MNRNYNVSCKNSTKNSSNYINVDISELDKIINHSAENIFCSCLNHVDSSTIDGLVNDILNKVKPGGTVTLSIVDVKKYASDFINGVIGGEYLLKILSNFKCILSIEDLYTKININIFNVKQVLKNDNSIDITIERMSI